MNPQNAPKTSPAADRDRDRDDGRLVRDDDAHPDSAEGAHQELALRADVEEPGLEPECDRQAGEDERRRTGPACWTMALEAADRALDQRSIGDERQRPVELVVREEQFREPDHERADHHREQDRDHGQTRDDARSGLGCSVRGWAPSLRSRDAVRHLGGLGRPPTGRHQEPDLVLVRRAAVHRGDDPAAVHDGDPVRQSRAPRRAPRTRAGWLCLRRASGSPGDG